ncbi:hypothetical protein EVAR_63934_1 [Eumeta japonica]|uniref:Uncharacterized protein n=1 Tax=Eumeta variegata TaxID=151549 RepID=A0A4C1ZI25_EUMVA|nr:hypothetical protein EVAR_63934_1 [Eumeta japonica]
MKAGRFAVWERLNETVIQFCRARPAEPRYVFAQIYFPFGKSPMKFPLSDDGAPAGFSAGDRLRRPGGLGPAGGAGLKYRTSANGTRMLRAPYKLACMSLFESCDDF